jgi:predicted CXXCH cytochrome family protein
MSRVRRWHWLLLGGVAVALILATLGTRASRSPGHLESVDLPPVSASPFLNTDTAVAYVGSSACIACHSEQHDSYLATMHSRSLNEIDLATEPADATFEVPETQRVYSTYRADGQLRHRQSFKAADGTVVMLADHPLRYVVGSGNLSRTYLVETGGFLVESPLTWYSSQGKWGLSPGYEKEDSGFARPVYFDCINCHAGNVTPSPETDGLMTIRDTAIGCERCHGPGELHVRARSASRGSTENFGATGIDATIVNPAKLDRERAVAVCAQCHLDGKASVELTGRRTRDYRPGLLWSDFRIDYSLGSSPDSMTVVGHVEQMRASRCYQASDSMTCTTCHDPHSQTPAADRPAENREICLRCHQAQGCRLAEPERRLRSPQDLCATCHMPKTPSDVPHVAATHHRVGIHMQPAEAAENEDELVELLPLSDVSQLPKSEQHRNLGLAYLQLSVKEANADQANEFRLRARSQLHSARRQLPRDGELLGALASCASFDEPRQAIVLAEDALKQNNLTPRGRVRTMFALCDAYCREQQLDKALPWFEQLVLLRRQGGDWFRLAVCRDAAGDLDGAVAAAVTAVEIMPAEPRFHELLVEISNKQGNLKLAAEHRRLAHLLRIPRGGD